MTPRIESGEQQVATPRLGTQAFWLIVARVIGFAFTIALPVVVVRVFDQQQFGAYKQAFIVVATATTFLPFGFGVSAFYYLSRLPEKRNEVIFNIVLYHLVIGALAFFLLALSPGILRLIFNDDTLTPLSALIGMVVWTWVFSSFLEMVATATADVTYSTLFIIGAQITKTALLIGFAARFRTVDAVLWAALVQGLIQSGILLWYLQIRFPGYWRHFDRAMMLEQFGYVAPLGIYGLLYAVQTDMHNYLVANRFTAAEYAIYAVGTTQLPFARILRDSVNAVILPRISMLQKEGRRGEILDVTIRAWRKLSAALFPACAALLVLGRDFIAVFYTPKYLASWPIFAVNLCVVVFAVFVSDAIVRAYAERRFLFLKIRFFTALFQVPASILAMNLFGMIGALIGVLFVTILERMVSLGIILHMLGFRWKDMRKLSGVVGFAFASVISAVTTWLAVLMLVLPSSHMRLLIGTAVFGIAYAASVTLLRLPDAEERELVNRYSSRFLGFKVLQ